MNTIPDPHDWDPDERFPEPVYYPTSRVITGNLVEIEPGYARTVSVGQPILMALLAAAGIARTAGRLLATAVRAGARASGGRRPVKELKKGPEYLVTPVRLRDRGGVLRAVEIHGYFPPTSLRRGDHVQLRLRSQKDAELPPRVERLANLSSGRVLTPTPPTLWSHLGPALLLQAALGALLAVATVAAFVAAGSG